MAGNDLGSLLGSLLGGGQGGAGGGAGNILGALLGALGTSQSDAGGGGALEGLIGRLAESGLLEQAQSWVGTGENQAVSGAQIARALPDETLRQVAEQTGVTTEQAADEIARSLPTAVDRLTPSGEVPAGRSIEELVREQRL
ncbi:YidB family protein [Streptomyces sp. NPDC002476]|uniref:YidB family protein n=1 Tax=Streptomyces sp. NPDC002476 TaxID=3364648 RepID=UPI00368F966E